MLRQVVNIIVTTHPTLFYAVWFKPFCFNDPRNLLHFLICALALSVLTSFEWLI
jgi:hypothetical protein